MSVVRRRGRRILLAAGLDVALRFDVTEPASFAGTALLWRTPGRGNGNSVLGGLWMWGVISIAFTVNLIVTLHNRY